MAKRRTRKNAKVQKAIVGISLEEIKQRRAAKPDPSKVCFVLGFVIKKQFCTCFRRM